MEPSARPDSSNHGPDSVEFRVGENSTSFLVRRQLFTRLSNFLDRAIGGDYTGHTTGKGWETGAWTELLAQITPRTFSRFCQFAYHGDYAASQPERRIIRINLKLREEEGLPTVQFREIASQWRNPDPAWRPRMQRREDYYPGYHHHPEEQRVAIEAVAEFMLPPLATATEDEASSHPDIPAREDSLITAAPAHDEEPANIDEAFRRRVYTSSDSSNGPVPEATVARACRPPRQSARDDWVPILKVHVELYGLARQTGVTRLSQLCLSKIHAILLNFDVTVSSIDDVVELARYAYGYETYRMNIILGFDDPLDELLAQFFAWRVTSAGMGENRKFQKLLLQDGRFAMAFWKQIWRWRINM